MWSALQTTAFQIMSGTSLFRLGRSIQPHLTRPALSASLLARPQSRRSFASTAPTASPPTFAEAGPAPAAASQQAVVEPVANVAGSFEFLDPWVPTIHNLAETLHLSGPHAHVLSIVALAFTLRTVVTLPITLWQRGKTRKLADHVLPEWNKMKEEIPLAVRARCRRSGKSYEEFNLEVKKELKDSLAKLLRKHNASPLPSFLGPALANIPIFILMTALLRQSALDPSTPFASEVLPWWSPPPELAAQFKVSASILADRGLDPDTIARLQGPMGGPTLADRDPTMIGPISFGMLTMANTELNSWSRRSIAKLSAATNPGFQRAKQPKDAAAKTAENLLADPDTHETRRGRIITNALRVLAIAFIPIAMQAPGVLIVYWLSSGVYTLLQNSVLAVIDRKHEAKKLAKLAAPRY